MTDKKDVKAQRVDELEVLVGQGDMDAKRELARRLMRGKGFHKNEQKVVALLEDCVAIGDAEAMLMLAKCCALGHGMEPNAEREAQCLVRLINDWKGKHKIYPVGLSGSHWKLISSTHLFFFSMQCATRGNARLRESAF